MVVKATYLSRGKPNLWAEAVKGRAVEEAVQRRQHRHRQTEPKRKRFWWEEGPQLQPRKTSVKATCAARTCVQLVYSLGFLEKPRKTSVKASIFADVLRRVYSLGFLELVAGPWCYGQRVRVSATPTSFDYLFSEDDSDGEGGVLWPHDGILTDWAIMNRDAGWRPGHGFNPGNSLAVHWSDGDLRYYRADFEFDEHDMQIIVPPQGLQGDAPVRPVLPFVTRDYLFASHDWLYPASARAEVANMAANAQTQTEVARERELPSKGRVVFKERITRYMYLCSELHRRELYNTLLSKDRISVKRRFLRFLEWLYQAFDCADEQSFEWWKQQLLIG